MRADVTAQDGVCHLGLNGASTKALKIDCFLNLKCEYLYDRVNSGFSSCFFVIQSWCRFAAAHVSSTQLPFARHSSIKTTRPLPLNSAWVHAVYFYENLRPDRTSNLPEHL